MEIAAIRTADGILGLLHSAVFVLCQNQHAGKHRQTVSAHRIVRLISTYIEPATDGNKVQRNYGIAPL